MRLVSLRPILVVFLGALLFAIPAAHLHAEQPMAYQGSLVTSAADSSAPEILDAMWQGLSASENRRRFQAERSDDDLAEPEYQLIHEWTLPPVAELTVGYQQNRNQALDWILTTRPSQSRLAGWKESNLCFRLNQPLPIIA